MSSVKLLVDENMPRKLVVALKRRGAVVLWVPDSGHRSASDSKLIELANSNDMFIITKDRDFSVPENRERIKTGVVYFDMDIPEDAIAALADSVMRYAMELKGKIAVITKEHTLVEELKRDF